MDDILHIQDYFEYKFRTMEKKQLNRSTKIYVNKIENIITFKVNKGYYLELLTPETIKLLGSTKSKVTKDKNGENILTQKLQK